MPGGAGKLVIILGGIPRHLHRAEAGASPASATIRNDVRLTAIAGGDHAGVSTDLRTVAMVRPDAALQRRIRAGADAMHGEDDGLLPVNFHATKYVICFDKYKLLVLLHPHRHGAPILIADADLLR